MATKVALNSTSGTTQPINTKTAESAVFLSGRGKKSSSAQTADAPFSCGENSLMTAGRQGSIALPSEMKPATFRRSLSDKLTQSLIMSGLVKGITPSSTRNELGAAIPDFVLLLPDGTSVDLRSQDC
jgi:hypothetical protein